MSPSEIRAKRAFRWTKLPWWTPLAAWTLPAGWACSTSTVAESKPPVASPPPESSRPQADTVNGTSYRNPILPGTNPDPSICRVDDDYYLVTSSFEYFPGVPMYHSKDLVNWRQLGHVLTRPSQLDLTGVESSKGIFAPTLRCHDGVFYMVTTNMQGGGSFYVTAESPEGPWSDPIWVRENVFTMDPSLFFDDDGKAYYTRHGEARNGGIFQAEIDIKTGELAAPAREIWRGTGDIWPEGPHLYKVNGTYYLMISEGGTSYEHMVTVARSSSPWGPYEAYAANPILTHRKIPQHPIQATGHSDIVQTPTGDWWMVLLGIRPSTTRRHHIGRETFLAPFSWSQEGWPMVNAGNPVELQMPSSGLPEPHPWPAVPVREEFDAPLGPQWNYLRNPEPSRYTLTERPGFLRLKGTSTTLTDLASPTVVLQRQQSLAVHAATQLHFAPQPGQAAGMVVRGNEDNHYTLLAERCPDRPDARCVVARARIAGETRELGRQVLEEKGAAGAPLVMLIDGHRDRYEFSVESGNGERVKLGSAPTTPFAYEESGSFTGAFLGLVAIASADTPPAIADFGWWEMRPEE